MTRTIVEGAYVRDILAQPAALDLTVNRLDVSVPLRRLAELRLLERPILEVEEIDRSHRAVLADGGGVVDDEVAPLFAIVHAKIAALKTHPQGEPRCIA